MKTQHTQGPWINDGLEIFSESGGFENYSVATISDRFLSTKQDEIFANANLIAAAPDLLAACEEAASFLTIWGHEPKNNYEKALKKMLDATIKKARGES